MNMSKTQFTLGIVLPSNNPDAMRKYLLPSLRNLTAAKEFVTFLINYQSPWSNDEAIENSKIIESEGFHVLHTFNQYEVKGKGLVPINRIREDTANINPYCNYYLIFDDDMSFLAPSSKMPRSAGEQIVESLIYMEKNQDCGIIVFGGSLIKKIPRDSIAPIHPDKEYVTGRGIIFRNINVDDSGLLLPKESHHLLGSDEEKVAAGYRISLGYYVAEMPFVRINHYENQLSARNKSGKIPGKDMYEWNTDEIKDSNNFGFIREHYNPNYKSGKGNIVTEELHLSNGGIKLDKLQNPNNVYSMSFVGSSTDDLIKLLKGLISK